MNTQSLIRIPFALSIFLISGILTAKQSPHISHSASEKQKHSQEAIAEQKQKYAQETSTISSLSEDHKQTHAQEVATTSPIKSSSARKTRKQKKEQKLTKQSKTISQMDLAELAEAKKRLLASGNKHTAIKYIEYQLKLCKEIPVISELTIELADLHFDLGELAKAEHLYSQFSVLYPGNKAIEYASYKAILCSFYATLSADRDQSKTHQTIALTNSFLDRSIFTKHRNDVEKIRESCYEKAAQSEIKICMSYIKRKRPSAEKRLENIRKNWLTKCPKIEPQLAQLDQMIKGDTTLMARSKQMAAATRSIEKKSETPEITLAQAEEPQKTFTNRF